MDLLKKIYENDESTLLEIYQTYREEFIEWAVARYHVPRAVAEDIFQDSVIALYDNVRLGRLTMLNCSLKTYIFAIGKHKLLNEQVKSRKIDIVPAFDPEQYDADLPDMLVDPDEQTIFQEKMNLEFTRLCEDCRTVLKLYYFKRMSMVEIARIMGYKNSNVAKKKKYECFKKLAARLPRD